MNDVQKITLTDILREMGLDEQAIRDLMLLLWFKPPSIQLIFYYSVQGWSQARIAHAVGLKQPTVQHHLEKSLSDIREYLREAVNDKNEFMWPRDYYRMPKVGFPFT